MADDMMKLALHGIGCRLIEDGSFLLSTARAGGARAAPAASKLALKDAIVGEGGQHECAICLLEDQVHEAARWKEMPCGHRFHGSCLEKWLHAHDTCPMCRRPLSPPAPEMTRAEWMDLRYSWFVDVQKFREWVAEYTRTHPC